MRNNNYTRPPRKGVIVFASFVFAALFIIAFIISYEQRTDLAHSVHLSPISANYGMVSTVRSSSLAVPMHSTAPLLSSGTIHAYAYSGHATMPSTGSSSGFRIHTLSSATMHSYGSGGGGGGAVSGGSSSSPSSQTIRYSGASVSMPSLAMAAPVRTYADNGTSVLTASSSSASSAPARHGHIRRAAPDDDGEPGARAEDDEVPGKYWYWHEVEGWVTGNDIPVGTLWNNGGSMMRWDGSGWVSSESHVSDPTNVPIGTTPWLLMILLTCVYALGKNYVSYSKYEKIS